MRISDWSSDVCSSDLSTDESAPGYAVFGLAAERRFEAFGLQWRGYARIANLFDREYVGSVRVNDGNGRYYEPAPGRGWVIGLRARKAFDGRRHHRTPRREPHRSDEHTSELQPPMRISYAVFCMNTKIRNTNVASTN